MSNPNRVRWYVNLNQEDERIESAILLEVRKDDRGLYALVNDGEEGNSSKILDLWKLTAESYQLCKELYPHLWDNQNPPNN